MSSHDHSVLTLDTSFSDELLLLCFSYLNPSDLAQLMLVSSKLKRIASDNTLWRVLFLREFSALFIKGAGNQAPNYYLMFKAAMQFAKPMLAKSFPLTKNTPDYWRDSAFYVENSLSKYSYGFFPPEVLDIASLRLRSDENFASRVAAIDTRYLARLSVPSNDDLIKWVKRLAECPGLLGKAPDILRGRKSVVLDVVRKNGLLFKQALVTLREDEAFVIELVQESYFVAAVLPQHFYDNKAVMLAALSNNVDVFPMVSERLKQDADLLALKSIDDDDVRQSVYREMVSPANSAPRFAA